MTFKKKKTLIDRHNNNKELVTLGLKNQNITLPCSILSMEAIMCSKRTKTRACEKQQKKNKKKKTSLITLLPEDVLIDCIARVPKQNYPTLDLPRL